MQQRAGESWFIYTTKACTHDVSDAAQTTQVAPPPSTPSHRPTLSEEGSQSEMYRTELLRGIRAEYVG